MKKILVTLLLATGCVFSSHAQGTVVFANNAATLITDNTQAGAPAVAGQFFVALYWGTLGSVESSLVNIGPAGITPTQTTGIIAPGRYSGGTYTTGNATPQSGTATFQVRAWKISNGATYEIASATPGAVFGKSALFTSATGGGVNPAILLAGVAPGFAVGVPEPSTIVLSMLGAAALLFRRKKSA